MKTTWLILRLLLLCLANVYIGWALSESYHVSVPAPAPIIVVQDNTAEISGLESQAALLARNLDYNAKEHEKLAQDYWKLQRENARLSIAVAFYEEATGKRIIVSEEGSK